MSCKQLSEKELRRTGALFARDILAALGVSHNCHRKLWACAVGSFDEVACLAFKLGLGRRDAFIAYLKEAGVWKEPRLAPSIMPGQRKRRAEAPVESSAGPVPGTGLGPVNQFRELVRRRTRNF
jgi:hypothetical protein